MQKQFLDDLGLPQAAWSTFADDGELARRIRDGALDDRLAEVRELVWADVRAKLAVANPKYLGDDGLAARCSLTVSYTHLTLPTSDLV